MEPKVIQKFNVHSENLRSISTGEGTISQVKVLVVANMYPHIEKPYAGSFIKEQVETIQRKGITSVLVANLDSSHGPFNALRKYALLAIRIINASIREDIDLIYAQAIRKYIAFF